MLYQEDNMKLIVITQEQSWKNEAHCINLLFENGLELLHLRKPGYTKEEISALLNDISPCFHRNIVIHDHFSLLTKFDLKGIHLNRRNPVPIKKQGITISKSCHSLEEIKNWNDRISYAFLSPIFNSISKTGYQGAFTEEELQQAKEKNIINEKIIALGGITAENIPQIKSYGFGGIAVLGSLWEDIILDKNENNLLERFKKIQFISNE